MASAGRILIMPKGSYDSTVTYEMLDLVKHNGTSWLARKTSVGIEPSETNSEYWQDMFDFQETTSKEVTCTNIINNVNLLRNGNVCQIYFGTTTEEVTSYEENLIAYIPEAFRPSVDRIGVIPICMLDENLTMCVTVNPTGELRVSFPKNVPSGRPMYGVFTYII